VREFRLHGFRRGAVSNDCPYRASVRVFRVLTHMYGPAVRCKRFVDLVVSGLASMYPAFDWSVLCSGPSWISARVRSH
jgi:hypothetical protein